MNQFQEQETSTSSKRIENYLDKRKNTGTSLSKIDAQNYFLIYKNKMSLNVVAPITSTLFQLHKEAKKLAFQTYYNENGDSISIDLIERINTMIKEEFQIYKTKYENEREVQLQKILNELYIKCINLNSDLDFDSMKQQWKKLEEEFLFNSKSFNSDIKFKVLFNEKNLRFTSNIDKLQKKFIECNLEINELKNYEENHTKRETDLQKQNYELQDENFSLKNRLQRIEDTLKEISTELEDNKFICEKQNLELQNFRSQEIKQNVQQIRSSIMFEIDTSNDRNNKCSECNCLIY